MSLTSWRTRRSARAASRAAAQGHCTAGTCRGAHVVLTHVAHTPSRHCCRHTSVACSDTHLMHGKFAWLVRDAGHAARVRCAHALGAGRHRVTAAQRVQRYSSTRVASPAASSAVGAPWPALWVLLLPHASQGASLTCARCTRGARIRWDRACAHQFPALCIDLASVCAPSTTPCAPGADQAHSLLVFQTRKVSPCHAPTSSHTRCGAAQQQAHTQVKKRLNHSRSSSASASAGARGGRSPRAALAAAVSAASASSASSGRTLSARLCSSSSSYCVQGAWSQSSLSGAGHLAP